MPSAAKYCIAMCCNVYLQCECISAVQKKSYAVQRIALAKWCPESPRTVNWKTKKFSSNLKIHKFIHFADAVVAVFSCQ